MKKTIAKKVLTLTSTILMTLLMVLGFNGTRVQADTNDTTTQNVVLTKYGFDKDVTAIDRATDQMWNGNGAKPLQGVDFTIYNVTANYWASPKDYKGGFDSASVAATGTTNDKGQLTRALPTQSKDASGKTRAAVYLFHETNPRAGYNTSADFWLTLPMSTQRMFKRPPMSALLLRKMLRLKKCLKEPALRLAIVMASF